MSGGRDQILGALRRSLKRGPLEGEAAAALERRLAEGPRGPQPAPKRPPRPRPQPPTRGAAVS